MTALDIIDYAAKHGYPFEVATAAIKTHTADVRAGDDSWDDRGFKCLLDAHMPRKVYTTNEIYDARRVRV